MLKSPTVHWIRRGLWVVLAGAFVWSSFLGYVVGHELEGLRRGPGCASGITKPLVHLLNGVVPISATTSIALIVLGLRLRIRLWPPLLAITLLLLVAKCALLLLDPFFGPERHIVWWLL